VVFLYRGVGKWIVRLMEGFFDNGSGSSEPEDLTKKGMYDHVHPMLFIYQFTWVIDFHCPD